MLLPSLHLSKICCFVFFSKHCQPRDHISTSNPVVAGTQRRKLRPGYVCDWPKVTLMGSCFPLSSKCWMSWTSWCLDMEPEGCTGVSQHYFVTGQLSDLGEVTGSSGKATLSLGLLGSSRNDASFTEFWGLNELMDVKVLCNNNI